MEHFKRRISFGSFLNYFSSKEYEERIAILHNLGKYWRGEFFEYMVKIGINKSAIYINSFFHGYVTEDNTVIDNRWIFTVKNGIIHEFRERD